MSNLERRERRYQRRKRARAIKRSSNNRTFDNFESFANPEKLKESFSLCKRGVSWKNSTQLFERDLLINILKAYKTLESGKSVTLGFKEFKINERGKIRHIKSTHMCERMVQRSLCENVLNPILSKTLIYDNGASLKNKGVGFTRKRLVQHLVKFYKEHKSNGYVLLMDYSKYFDSINHEILIERLKRYIRDPKTFSICEQYIKAFGDRGLGLGSQISQILAVFFPNPIDHYIKEHLRIKYYGRYMDDSYILSSSKKDLEYYLSEIIPLCERLGININLKKTKILKLSNGFNFLHCRYHYGINGKIIKCGGRESAKRIRKRLRYFEQKFKIGEIDEKYIRDCYLSWRGNMKQFHSREIIINMDKYFNSLFPKIQLSKGTHTR